MTYKAAAPCELWSENVKLNPASFSSSNLASDDWRTTASIGSMPARLSHATDTTAYATQPVEDSWTSRYYGNLSPAKATNGSTGQTWGGQTT